MKYIKLYEHTYSIYDLITMPEYQAGELLIKEIEKRNPDIQFINNLLEYSKVYVNWQNSKGETALMTASYRRHIKIVKLLLEKPEIDVNLQTEDGWTALIWASANGYTEIVQMLLERPEIDVNLQDRDGYTAYIFALANRHKEVSDLIRSHSNFNETL